MRTFYGSNLPQEPSLDTEMAVDQPAVEEASFTTVTNKKSKGKGKVPLSTNPSAPSQNVPTPALVVSRAPPPPPPAKTATIKPTPTKVAIKPQAPKQASKSFIQAARSENSQFTPRFAPAFTHLEYENLLCLCDMFPDPKSAVACLNAWTTSFARPSSQGRHFLPLKGGIKNLLQPSYAKGRGWLLFIGESVVTLCARATRAILNHAPIGEFRQHFFPAECTQCPCGHCQVETCRQIFANCRRFAHFPLTDLVPTVKDFVKFLKEHPSAFAFPSQDRLFSEPPKPP